LLAVLPTGWLHPLSGLGHEAGALHGQERSLIALAIIGFAFPFAPIRAQIPFPQAPTTASLSGAVRDESNISVPATVTIATQGLRQSALTAADGSFTFTNLKTGMYAICAVPVEARYNPSVLAYQGFAIGDSALDTRLANWAEWEMTTGKRPALPPALLAKRQGRVVLVESPAESDGSIQQIRQLWAEALVDKYGGVLSEAQWRSDPIASRLPASMAQSLHNDMIRRTSEIMQKRVTR
jgi:hypothetical protein